DGPGNEAFRRSRDGRGETSDEHNECRHEHDGREHNDCHGENHGAWHRRDGAQPDRRSFGSQASRRVSPKRLNPRTARLIARPGNTASHGACSKKARPVVLSMRPHDGSGGCVPTPRKVSDASIKIALPTQRVAMMRMAAATL